MPLPPASYNASSDYPPATSPPVRPAHTTRSTTSSTLPRSMPLRVNTSGLSSTPSSSAATTTAGGRTMAQSPARSDFKRPLYDIPTSLESPKYASSSSSFAGGGGGVAAAQSRARPGGLAAMASMENGRYRAHNQPLSKRRGSSETSVVAPSTRRGSDHALPRPTPVRSPPPAGSMSCTDREGSVYVRRIEGVTSPTPADLQLFAHHCRLFYFSPAPPQDSASFISSTLAALPANHRAAYTRLQSSLRSLAHLHHLRVRISSFHALISSINPSGSLTPSARQDLVSSRARVERREQLSRFLGTWCTSSAGGVEPFFRGLWSAFRVQSRGEESRGGGGARRVVWEIDDAVFLESGGSEFMHECVSIMKGVLGFDDQPLTSPPKLRRIRTLPRGFSSAQSRRGPHNVPARPFVTTAPVSHAPQPVEELITIKPDNRSRASSDPFLDPGLRSTVRSTNGNKPQLQQPQHPTTTQAQQPQARYVSGRGPAPPPPPSRRRVSDNKQDTVPVVSALDPLQNSHSNSSIDLAAPYPLDSGSQAESPLLPLVRERSSSTTVQALEDAAENVGLLTNSLVTPSSRHNLPPRSSDDNINISYGRLDSDRAEGAALLSAPDNSNGDRVTPRSMAVHTVMEGNEDEGYNYQGDDDDDQEPNEDDIAAEEIELNRPRFRLWTFPSHISDEEAESLMALFPAFIRHGKSGKAKDPRFPFVRADRRIQDLEMGGNNDASGWDKIMVVASSGTGNRLNDHQLDANQQHQRDRVVSGNTVTVGQKVPVYVPKIEVEDDLGVVRSGTGRMWVGLQMRRADWAGGAWFRFARWWRRLFGMG